MSTQHEAPWRARSIAAIRLLLATLCASLLLGSAPALAAPSLPGHPAVGLDVSWLDPLDVSGGIGPFTAESQSLTLGAQVYADWQLSDLLAVGIGLPSTLNAPGPSSNAYDLTITPRLRIGYPLTDWLYPNLLLSAGPGWSRQPQHVWISGYALSAAAGVDLRVTRTFWAAVNLSYRYTSFSGDYPEVYAPGNPVPVEHGSVQVSYLGIGGGFELRF